MSIFSNGKQIAIVKAGIPCLLFFGKAIVIVLFCRLESFLDYFSSLEGYWIFEERTIKNEGVELSVLSGGINF